ncbi:hypothetical protein CS542_07720 [Pedobacter sp. IW39]|nr:hypothetical protein CS542_07720 [Pedobacter sp. IW39]
MGFWDGQSSTEASPVHIYPGKENMSLHYATVNGQSAEASTVIRIAKAVLSNYDQTLEDWNTDSTNVITSGVKGGVLEKSNMITMEIIFTSI